MKKSSKNRLTPGQRHRFASDSLFDRIARVVCTVGTLPRKELYESWEVARRVRRRIRGGRIIDLAAGHGLLAHILMILDDTSPKAVAVDTHIPKNAQRLSDAMLHQWPRLKERVQYVQTKIEDIAIDSSDLVVSAHACGGLTDTVLDKAIEKKAAVAVLPCCHEFSKTGAAGLSGWLDEALTIDVLRAIKLEKNGYQIFTQTIPDEITPKNRLLIGKPEKK